MEVFLLWDYQIGYGSVYKLSGKRRKPYIARITVGWSDEGKQLYETIGTYETKQLAFSALAEYNNNPSDIKASKITFSGLPFGGSIYVIQVFL
mgnify:CR=1 FL=1